MDTVRLRQYHRLVLLRALFIFSFVATFTFLALWLPRTSSAVSHSDFRPGNIISDYMMSKSDTMTVSEIQAFLDEKGNCADTDIVKASWYPSLHYHIEDGHFVCLSSERFATSGTHYGDTLEDGEESKTAAEIIYDVAQEYSINPQVLIVLLEKEQGLISDSWPNSRQYKVATGYGCPDTAPCDEKYYGFKNQLSKAAELFRTVLDGGWTNYPLGENYIYYNPNSSCGGSVVNVENLATSALYRYTPYQPNDAALSVGYGTAPCGAYGNRNFFYLFVDWFGDPTLTASDPTEAKTKFEHPVADGIYQIASKNFSGEVIDIRGGAYPGLQSGIITLYPQKTDKTDIYNQVFEVKYNESTGYYKITNPISGLVVDVEKAGILDQTSVLIWRPHSACNQDWLLEQDDDGFITFISRCSSKVLTATEEKGTVILTKQDNDSQKWKLVEPGVSIAPAEAIVDIQEENIIEAATNFNHLIPDGNYQIVSKNTAEVVDIVGGVYTGMLNGKISLYRQKTNRSEGVENQVFSIKYNRNTGFYNLINPTTGLYIDVEGSNTNDNTPTIVWTANGGCNQDWLLEQDDDGFITFISRCSSKVLTTNTDKTITINRNTHADAQKWRLIEPMSTQIFTDEPTEAITKFSQPVENGTYQIISKAYNPKAIDIRGGVYRGMKNGETLIYEKKNAWMENQLFEIRYNSNTGFYNIFNPTSWLYIDVEGLKTSNGTPVIVWSSTSGCNQDWLLEQDDDGFITFISRCSSKALTAGSDDGITISARNGSDIQKWKLEKR